MRNRIIFFFILLTASSLSAQPTDDLQQIHGVARGGFGFTIIEENGEETLYYTLSFQPELMFLNFGLGLNIDLLYNPDPDEGEDNLREEDLKLEKILRYVRWGNKRDPIYARVGELDRATLGHGFIMGNYQNQIIENHRNIGLEFDVSRPSFGFETCTSSFRRLEVIGGRFVYHPLMNRISAPIIDRLALGATAVGDMDPDRDSHTNDDIMIWGVDAELPILENKLTEASIYTDFAQIRSYGSGAAVGVQFIIPNLFHLMEATLRVEERFLGDEFMPQYFDSFYEQDRSGRLSALKGAESVNGTFGSLTASILNQITVNGSYQYYNKNDFRGTGHLGAWLNPNKASKFLLWGTYDKAGVETIEDLFTLDEQSLANAYFGYGINSFLYLTVQYEWTFHRDEQLQLITHERIIPRLEFSMRF